MRPILKKLAGGDRRSIGRSNEIVAEVLRHPSRLSHLFEGLANDDPLVRMRAADAIEKISAAIRPPTRRGLFINCGGGESTEESRRGECFPIRWSDR